MKRLFLSLAMKIVGYKKKSCIFFIDTGVPIMRA